MNFAAIHPIRDPELQRTAKSIFWHNGETEVAEMQQYSVLEVSSKKHLAQYVEL